MMFYLTGDIRYTIAVAIVYHFLINYITKRRPANLARRLFVALFLNGQ